MMVVKQWKINLKRKEKTLARDIIFLRNAVREISTTETTGGFITIQEAEQIIKERLCLHGEVTFDWKSEEVFDIVKITSVITRSHTKED